jgi:hypothetical protein
MGDSLNLLPATYEDFRRDAERRLPRFLFDYIDGGAGAEVTLAGNSAAWEQVTLAQKVLRDASKLDCAVELFGEKLAMPLVLAPIGMGGLSARLDRRDLLAGGSFAKLRAAVLVPALHAQRPQHCRRNP